MFAQTLSEPIRYLALGDSYTIGASVSENERWPIQLRDSLTLAGYNFESTEIIAVTGWRTDNLMNGIVQNQPDSNYNLVSLLIGVNNQFQGSPINKFRIELDSLIRWSIALAQGNPNQVFMVSIPDYGYTPFGSPQSRERISRELDNYNSIKDSLAQVYNIPYYYITDISRRGLEETDLVADDNLHPSGKQYTLWVERILPELLNTTSTDFPKSEDITITSDSQSVTITGIIGASNIQVVNMEGKVVRTISCDADCRIEQLPSGIFIVSVDNQGKKYTKKVIIQ